MKGFVPTPSAIVDLMVEKLFLEASPYETDTVLDPGCGEGAFIEGIIRWCKRTSTPMPEIIGIDSDPKHIPIARNKFKKYSNITIRNEDFLTKNPGQFNYIIGNPPYVPITKLSEMEKVVYRALFKSAQQRFDLYLLFFEQALKSLKNNGKLVFITPEKFLYVKSATNLRTLLNHESVIEIQMIHEQSFRDLTTYPTITSVINSPPLSPTRVILRDDTIKNIELSKKGESWLPIIHGRSKDAGGKKLKDFCIRISCGVATGADSIFIKKKNLMDKALVKFSYPTISGKQLTSQKDSIQSDDVMLVPYNNKGELLNEEKLGALRDYLIEEKNYSRLIARTCYRKKPWYAYHETPPLKDILKPKILCKDITAKPKFWIDREGVIVPRHSVYYLVPEDVSQLDEICAQLNSNNITKWLEQHCQRASNGFIRLQSEILKQIPISDL
ncbi:MAG TPA: DNA methyltransferase [Bacteroidetes bacterium]|nr:DNA methyltransferase [Bacteroidota bacterium]